VSYKLGIVTSHPIQYHAHWFRELAKQPAIDLEIFYCHRATPQEQAAAGFGVEFDWDVSLLDGYHHRFLDNIAAHPRVSGFNGLDTPEIKSVISEERFDAVIINGWHYKSAWQAIRACWRTGTPVMVRSDSHLHTERHPVRLAVKWPFYRWFIPKLDACLATGQWSKEYFLHYGARQDRIFIVPHVIDTDYFSHESRRLWPERSKLRAKWNLRDDHVVFLFAGKFIQKKRPMDFVRAVAEAAASGASISGLMVGDGPLRELCEEFVAINKAPVKFAGFLNQTEITAAYVAADALVLPSDGAETWGLVVNEAMACGLPCLVSDRVGCGPDMIVPNETGATFRMGDSGGIANMLVLLASGRRRLCEMGRLAREKSQQYSTKSAIISTMTAVSAVCSKN
jgi:glycosyltransferase involved in cell wall biosynthesis